MTQRASGLAKRQAAAKVSRVSDTMRAAPGAAPASCEIPLLVAPLLAPYKKSGRLSLRIERLHHLGRLSVGRNNGDGTWSLSTDELEELTYILPEGINEAHTLAVRVIGLDEAAGSTLAVIDLPVSPGAQEIGDDEAPADSARANDAPNLERLSQLHDELAAMKSQLAARDAELAAARRDIEATVTATTSPNAELAKARADWEKELRQQLVAAANKSAATLETARTAWETEQATRLAKMEENSRTRLEEARGLWQRVAQESLRDAEERWRAEETARLAAAESHWESASAQALAEALANVKARGDNDQKEREHLVEEIGVLQAKLSEREVALTRANLEVDGLRQQMRREAEDALVKAEQEWKASESERLAAAKAQWHADLERSVADAKAEIESRALADAVELRQLREEVDSMRRCLAEEEAALARATADVAAVREQARRDAQEALKKAEQSWKADEAARLASAAAQWQDTMEQAVARAREEANARNPDNALELARLRIEMEGMRNDLSARETALARSGLEIEQLRERARRDGIDGLKTAEQAWSTEEAARLAAAQAQWQAKSNIALSELRARLETTEAELLSVKKVPPAAATDDKELERLRGELRGAHAIIAASEAALKQAQRNEDALKSARETEVALKREKAEWVAEADARFAAAEAQWQKQSALAVAEAISRSEAAETALARVRVELARERASEVDISRLRGELTALQMALAERESELIAMRSAFNEGGGAPDPESRIVLRPNRSWSTADPEMASQERDQEERKRRLPIRDVIIAATLTTMTVMFYPIIAPYIPAEWRQVVSEQLEPIFGAPQPVVQKTAPAPAPARARVAVQPVATIIRDVNVRAGASTETEIVATLPRDRKVPILERSGNWTRVQIDGANGGPPRQGWVYNSFISVEQAGAPATPAPAN